MLLTFVVYIILLCTEAYLRLEDITVDSQSYDNFGEEEETDNEPEEEDKKMAPQPKKPTPKPKTPSKKKSPKKSSSPASPVTDLASSLQGTSLGVRLNPGFEFFNPEYKFPFKIAFTPYLSDGAMHCFVDIHVMSMHRSSFKVSVSPDGNELNLTTEVPRELIESERTASEFRLQGDNDSIQCAQVVTTSHINKMFPSSLPIASAPQVIILPFQVELAMTISLLWADGDEQLHNKFLYDPDIYDDERHQRMPFLRVHLRSTDKAISSDSWIPSQQTRNRTPPGNFFAAQVAGVNLGGGGGHNLRGSGSGGSGRSGSRYSNGGGVDAGRDMGGGVRHDEWRSGLGGGRGGRGGRGGGG